MHPPMHPRKRCVIFANCQGDPLAAILAAHPGFAGLYEIRQFTNYLGQSPGAELSACDLFLYQRLGPHWGDLATDNLLPGLPPRSKAIAIPNMLFKGYWPLWKNDPAFNFSDTLLDELVRRPLSKAEILYLCLKTDLRRKYDLDRLLDQSVAIERGKEKDQDIRTVDLVLSLWQSTRLFTSVNHPVKLLVFHVANAVLSLLDLPPFTPRDIEAVPEFISDIEQPIHPQVIDHFGLTCITPAETFSVYGRPMTYPAWVEAYVDAKRAGVTDFIGWLQGM